MITRSETCPRRDACVQKGKGVFNDDGVETVVRPGDICATGYGQSHGLENRTDEPVELIALIVME